MPMVTVTDNDCRIWPADQWTRQIAVDTYVSTGVYRVRRASVSPRRIIIRVEVDFKVAVPHCDAVVQRAPVTNRELSIGRPEVQRWTLRERATAKTAQQNEEEQTKQRAS